MVWFYRERGSYYLLLPLIRGREIMLKGVIKKLWARHDTVGTLRPSTTVLVNVFSSMVKALYTHIVVTSFLSFQSAPHLRHLLNLGVDISVVPCSYQRICRIIRRKREGMGNL